MAADLEIIIKGKDAGASKALDDVGGKMKDLDKAGGILSKGLNGLRDVMLNGLKVAAVGAGAALGGLVAGIGSSVNAAMDMEQQLADISASMGTTAEETGQLKTLIKDLGLDPKLKVSATEAADAIQVLGTAGVNVTDILGGAARSTVLLANATGADFADAAAIASDAMALWGVEAKDLNTVVNGVTSTTIASKFGIQDYKLALAAAGGVAATVGVEFDDFNAVIAAISPSFSSGSDAGTSFKTFLQRLVPGSNEARDAMRDLGLFTGLSKQEFLDAQDKIQKYQREIAGLDPTSKNFAERSAELNEKLGALRMSLVEGRNAFFDSNGSMKSMAEISGILNEAMAGLSEEQKNEALSTIFGTDAMRAAAAMADTGKEKFQALKDTMAKTDAEQQAATRMNTFKGALEILSGVFETLKIQIGEKFLPALTSMTAKFGEFLTQHSDKILVWADALAVNLEGLVNWIMVVVEDGDLMNDWLTHMHPNLQAVVLGVADFVRWMNDTVVPMARFVAEALGVKGVLVVLGGLFALSFIPVIVSTISTIVTVVSAVSSFIGILGAALPALGAVVAAAAPVIAIVAAIGAAIYLLYQAWQNNWFGIRDITWQAVDYIKNLFVNLPATLANLGSQMWAVGKSIVTSIGDGIRAAASWATDAMTSVINFVTGESQGRLSTLAGTLYESGRTVIAKVGEGFQAAKAIVNDQMNQVMTDIQNHGVAFAMGALLGRMYEAGRESLFKMGEGIRSTAPNLVSDMKTALDAILTTATAFKDSIFATATAIGNSLIAGLRAVDPSGTVTGLITGMMENFNRMMTDFKTVARSAAGGVMTLFGDGLKTVNVGVIMGNVIDAAIVGFNNVTGGFKNHAKGVASEIMATLGEGLRSVDLGFAMWTALQQVIVTFNAVLDGFKNHVWGVMSQVGKDISLGMAEGIRNAIGKVGEALNYLTSIAPQWVKDALGISSPSKVFAEIGNNIMAGLAQGIDQMTAVPQVALAGATDALVGTGQTTINNSRTTQVNNAFNVTGAAGGGRDAFETVRILNTLYGQA